MSRLALVFWIVLCAAAGHASVLCGSRPSAEMTCNTMDSALLNERIAKYVVNDADVLRITAENGTTIEFARNKGNDADHAESHVLAVIEPFHLLLVVVDRTERCERHLVDYKNGTHHRLDGWPLVSPDQQRLLIHSESVESNYCPNWLGIYRVNQGRLFAEYVVDGDSDPASSWGPIDPIWKDATTIQYTSKWYRDSVEMNHRITLHLDADGWHGDGGPAVEAAIKTPDRGSDSP